MRGLLGLAHRARATAAGTAQARDAVRAGRAAFVLIAADASENSRDKLVPLLEARGVPYAVAFDRAALGGALGHAALSAIALTNPALATRVRALIEAPGSDTLRR